MRYDEALDLVLSLPDMERRSQGPQAATMSLEAMKALLASLANPHLSRRTVHVAGSKGKGSSSAMIASVLSTKFKTMLYTSPHLHNYRERITSDLEAISEDEFAAGVERIWPRVLEIHHGNLGPISTFGVMNSLFFDICRWRDAQWQVVEVGLGGTYDGTNVFVSPEVVVITAISLEHTKILGSTLAQIAAQKGGIIKPGCTVILAEQNSSQVQKVIQQICKEQKANLIDVSKEYKLKTLAYSSSSQSFQIEHKGRIRRFDIQLLGEHQIENAASAIAAIDAIGRLGVEFTEEQLSEGLRRVFVPGRMEIVDTTPVMVLDGAHNGESMEALVNGLFRHLPGKSKSSSELEQKWNFVLGVNSDKDIKAILRALKPFCAHLIVTSSNNEKAMPTAAICEQAKLLGFMDLSSYDNCAEALEQARKIAGDGSAVCVTGSLYLVGLAREILFGKGLHWSLQRAANSQPGSTQQGILG